MGFGILVGSIGLAFRNVLMLVNTFYLVVVVFSGANFPLEDLPIYLRILSKIFPMGNSIKAAKLLIFKKNFLVLYYYTTINFIFPHLYFL